MAWTTAMDERVAELREQGLSYAKIASVMGITKNMIIGRMDRLRNPRIRVARSKKPVLVLEGVLRVRENSDGTAINCRIPTNIPIYELRRCECRWPTGEKDGIYLFCAAIAPQGQPYCAKHEQESRQEWRRSGRIDKFQVRRMA